MMYVTGRTGSAMGCSTHGRSAQVGEDSEDEEKDEADLGHPGRSARETFEAQHPGDERHHEKNNGVVEPVSVSPP